MDELEPLRARLAALTSGLVPSPDSIDVARHLMACWHCLECGSDGGIKAEELAGRIEGLAWTPPLISFQIELHGATVQGSTRSMVQSWQVDVDRGTASISGSAQRQLYQMEQRLDIRWVAAELAAAICQRRPDSRISWRDGAATVITASTVVTANRQTTAARRKRLTKELQRLMAERGWRRKSDSNCLSFEPPLSLG
jgi:hypothetical protein